MTATAQLNVALDGRYAIERELGAGGTRDTRFADVFATDPAKR